MKKRTWLLLLLFIVIFTAISMSIIMTLNTRHQLEKRVTEGPWAIMDLISDRHSLNQVLEDLWQMLNDNTGSSQSRSWAGNVWVSVATEEFDLPSHIGMKPDVFGNLIDTFLIQKYLENHGNPTLAARAGILLRQRTTPDATIFSQENLRQIEEFQGIIDTNILVPPVD